MAEELEVKYKRARAWLDSVRDAAGRIEPTLREIDAMRDAYDEMLTWRIAGKGGSSRTHSDPTAEQAMARTEAYEHDLAAKMATYNILVQRVGDCGRELEHMKRDIGHNHAYALELYYIDLADTWQEVADEMGVTRKQLWRIREQAYEWIESNCRLRKVACEEHAKW